jgi:hypothetical protein
MGLLLDGTVAEIESRGLIDVGPRRGTGEELVLP